MYLINALVFKIDYIVYIVLISYSLTFSIFFFIGLGKNKKIESKFYFRRLIIISFLLILDFITRYLIDIGLVRMISIIIVIYVLFSMISVFIFKKYATFNVVRESEGDLIPDDISEFKIKIVTPKWYKILPFNLGNLKIRMTYEIKHQVEEVEEFYFSSNKDLDIELDFKFKGMFQAGVSHVELFDTLSLIKIQKNYTLEKVIVHPEKSRASNYKFSTNKGEDEMIMQLINKGSRFDKKEYEPGDSLKHVDWKQYAKNKKLYLKEEELNSFVGGRVILYDNRKMFNGDLHRYVDTKQTELFISIVNTLIKEDEDFKFAYFTENKLIIKSKDDLDIKSIIEDISFIPFVKNINNNGFKDVLSLFKRSYKTDELLVISSTFDENIRKLVLPFTGKFSSIRYLYISTVKGRSRNVVDLEIAMKKYSLEIYILELLDKIQDHTKGMLK